MIIKILLPFLIVGTLFGAEDSWYKKLNPKIEAGIYSSSISGDISNISTVTDFSTLGLDDSRASFFSLSLRPEKKYIPNIKLSYFNMKENSDVVLTDTTTIADEDFNTSISTSTSYYNINALLYKDLAIKGKIVSVFGNKIYTGDLEFDVGINIKYLNWKYQVSDKMNLTRADSWIEIGQFISLPYLGVKYYRYNLLIYADISALSFQKAEATQLEFGIDYRMVDGLFLSMGYIYEDFDVLEDNDTVNFKTSGPKFSFKYAF